MTMSSERFEAHMGKREFIVLISMLMALTALSIDMMLPAFGDIRGDFGLAVDSNATALMVTVLLIGLGVGQLLWGPLADSLGRKRVLWVGLSIYIVAAIAGAFAPSLELLLLTRLVSGLGAAGIRVVTHGVIRDRYHGDEMAKMLSYIMAVFILVPMLAPSLGSIVLGFGSWRWIFATFAVAAALTAAWALRLPETLPPDRRIPLQAAQMLEAGKAVLGSRFSRGFTFAQMLVFGFFSSYLGSTQIIVDDVFGMAQWFPLIFGTASVMMGLATLANSRLIDRFGLRQMLRFALAGYLAAAAVFAVLALASGGHPPFWLYFAGLLPVLLMHGLTMPNLNSAAMMPMGHVAGTAAAIIGATATLGGAVIGAGIDAAYNGSITPMALAALAAAAAAFILARRSDALWERDAERQVLTPEEQVQAAAAAPIEVA
jgi:DHA1 family bicyclomycin/chloramphenicol resistance-like MFS transporter